MGLGQFIRGGSGPIVCSTWSHVNHNFLRLHLSSGYKLGNPGGNVRLDHAPILIILKVSAGSTGNLIGITSPAEHSHRRRIWDRAFTNTALDQYEPMIQRRAEQLVDVIRDHKETVIDLGIWISFFA
jgi:hypothetical protein